MSKGERKKTNVILFAHESDPDLLTYLKAENIHVVALLQAFSEDVQSFSIFDLFYGTDKIPKSDLPPGSIHLSDAFLYHYLNCISRISFVPLTEKDNARDIGIVGADNVVDWAQFHVQIVLHLIQSFKPDEIWIGHSPHLGIDNILVEVGKQLGLTVITFRQSLMPGKFFYNIVGNCGSNPKLLFTRPQHEIATKKIFYMQESDSLSNTQRLFERVSYYLMAPFKGERAQFTERLYLAFQRRDRALFLLLMDSLCARTRELAFSRFVRRRRFRTELKKRSFCHQDDLMKPFIYFALHLQPEASTAALGGYYANQMNAIEAMRKILPIGWQIFIKENPKQGYMCRGLPFYERMRQLSEVKFVEDSAKSEELIKQSRIVATITGTVGYEAIALGKPCVFFGNAWFEGLPNTFRFDDSLDLEEISRHETDAHELGEAVTAMMTEAADGVIMPYFRGILDNDVDWPGLMKTTAKSLARISDVANSLSDNAR